MQVKKIMTKNPACCMPDSTIEEVAHMMEMYDCGCIPVIDNHQTMHPVGTITDRDITIRTIGANKNPLEMKAADVMTTDIVTVMPDTSVQECMNVMENKQIRRVLVVDKAGRCMGIVAQADLAEHGEHPAQTANFVREVSESDQIHNRRFQSNNSQFEERKNTKQNNYSFSQNQSYVGRRQMRYKSSAKKESFFSSTTLLTLLGSIGLGAGLKYYFDSENENKQRSLSSHLPKNQNRTINKKNTDLSFDKSTPTITSKNSPVSTLTDDVKNRDVISGSVSSFDDSKENNELTATSEIGRSTSSR